MANNTIPKEYRTCAVCKWFSISFGSAGYSELTPGSEGSVYCRKNYGLWADASSTPDESQFYELVAQAKHCPSYEQRPE